MSRPFNNESVFHAIADPTRRRMLDMLRRGDLTPGELIAPLRLSKPAISHHLAVLRTSGLVRQHRRGRHRVYSLEPASFRQLTHWIAPYQALAEAGRRATRA